MTFPAYTRADWATRKPTFGALRLPVRNCFAHHTAGPYMPTFDVDAMRNLEASEIARGGYVALAYHELFPGDGAQVESRPVTCMGGATINQNSTSIAIVIPGNYALPGALVSFAQVASVVEWLSAMVFLGVLTADFALRPHSEVYATACPGVFKDHLFAIRSSVMPALPPGPIALPPAPNNPPAGDVHAFLEHLAQAVTETRRFLAIGLTIGRGAHNDAVWTVQLAVNVWQPGTLTVDSDFGNLTEGAVKGYQHAKGLKADGIVGVKTYAAMYPA